MNNNDYLLLVEDEPLVQANNKRILERRGYSIRQAFSLAEARAMIREKPPRAVVLDIGMPDGGGLDFLHELRQTSNIPVLLLTAMGTPQDIIKGLETGGDDYLTKPYELSVFLMRIQALLRRASLIPDTLSIGPLILEPTSGKAYLNSVDMGLSQKEYALLQQFIQHPEEIMSAECLYEKVLRQEMLEEDSSLKNIAYRLRKKLENSGYTITAVRGVGYIFERK